MAIWPWSVINRQKADITALNKALREESQLVGELKDNLKAELVSHQETRRALKIARDQREQFRVDLDNAVADLTAQQAKTLASQNDLRLSRASVSGLTNKVTSLQGQLDAAKGDVKELEEKLKAAEANDARDKATGKYVRQPDAAPKAPRVRKKALPKDVTAK